MENNSKLFFTPFGGAGSVTGANFFLTDGDRKILVDCGMFQGCKFCEDRNREPFPYDPGTVHALVVTHAHIDHIGRIPKLVRDGFRGTIFSTPATRELGAVMLEDSLGVLEKEARFDGMEPFYDADDVARSLALWRGVPLHEKIDLGGALSCTLRDSGHILGSSMAEVKSGDTNIVFTGDLGNTPAPLMRDPEAVTDATYLVMESVYGDRTHERAEERKSRLEDVIEETIGWGGALMVPAFSLERTQVLLYEINSLVERGRIPSVPVFVDSPLAIKVTDIYKRYASEFRASVRREIEGGDDIFVFPNLSFTLETEQSRAINAVPNPKIIIAGSGMSNGGRILHHERRYLPDEKSTLLLIGYQAPGSLGRLLQDGAREVTISGERVSVRARVETIRGYSAHMDSEGLIRFVEKSADTLRRVFVAMGEPRASSFLAQRIRDYLGVDAVVPEEGKTYELKI